MHSGLTSTNSPLYILTYVTHHGTSKTILI